MEDRVVGQSDKHWMASILSDDPIVVQSKMRLYNALDLPPAALHDVQTKNLFFGSGSYEFCYEILTRWISMNGKRAKFKYLLRILKEESFVAAADHLADKCIIVDKLSSRMGSFSLEDCEPQSERSPAKTPPKIVEKSSDTRNNTSSQKPLVDKTKQNGSQGHAPTEKKTQDSSHNKVAEKNPPLVESQPKTSTKHLGEEDELPALVFDIGCAMSKIGFGGDEEPTERFPTIVGKDNSKWIVGENAVNFSEYACPLKGGIVTDWDSMTEIWSHSFQTLQVSPEGSRVILMEPALVPKKNREMKAQIMFEKFKTSKLYLGIDALMSLCATGKTKGTVVQIGDGVTQVIPVYKDWSSPSVMQISTMNVSGAELTERMRTLLDESLSRGQSGVGFRTARDLKERQCYVAMDFDKEMQIVKVGNERFRCPELLFQPNYLTGMDSDGIHELIYKTIIKCPLSSRQMLFSNIVLSGGSTLFPGLVPRLQKELTELTSSTVEIKIHEGHDQLHCNWIGGSIMGILKGTEWITKAEYDECGPNIVHRKIP